MFCGYRKACIVALLGLLTSLFVSAYSRAENVKEIYAGDGMTVIVKAWSDNGTVTGDIQRGGKTFAFTGNVDENADDEVINGTFKAGNETFTFKARTDEDTGAILFTTGNKTYKLLPQEPAAKPDVRPDAPNRPGNPLDAPDAPKNPLDEPNTPPNPLNPLDQPVKNVPNPLEEKPQPPASVDASKRIELKLAKFPDRDMGGVIAKTMLVPADWKVEGFVAWGPADNPFPQTTITATGPDGSQVMFVPSVTLNYLEVNPVPGFPGQPPQGIKPPESIGQWIASIPPQAGRQITDKRLVDDRRDLATEKSLDEMDRATGGMNQGMTRTCHVVTLTYTENGTKFREEIGLAYVKYMPIVNQNIRSDMWSVFVFYGIRAPADKFEQTRPMLQRIASSVRDVPKWWVRMMQVRSEIIAKRHRDAMAGIKAAGALYDQMSDDQYNNWKKTQASSDIRQKDTIDGIYERQDYKDLDGSNVNMTFHYKHVYSNGQGGYILTNNSLDAPQDGNYKEIEPAK